MRERICRVSLLWVVLLGLFFLGIGCAKSKAVIDKPLPEGAYKADISVLNPPMTLKAGSLTNIKVKVKNTGNSIWPALGQPNGRFAINLGDHWLDKTGKILEGDVDRASLPFDIKPGEDTVLVISLKAPAVSGDYILEYDMVQENVTWFKERGSKTVATSVRVD